MPKSVEIKYPNSARLFSFCKSVLLTRFTNARVIDQDVGQILNFDPADCSHWKKGRKNIRSIDSIHAIATHLGVDERLVMEVASGSVTEVEAILEYKGLGPFQIDPAVPESIRNTWRRKQGFDWTPELETKLKAFFSINDGALQQIIDEILSRIGLKEAPLFLPEIANAYPNVRFRTMAQPDHQSLNSVDTMPRGRRLTDGVFEVLCPEGSPTRAVTRFHVVRAMAPFFIAPILEPAHVVFKDHESYMSDIYANVFAARLLVPAPLLRAEMSRINLAGDLVAQLSEAFWVSRALMNRRLMDVLSGSLY